jgi:hypothetical protein
MRHRRSRAMTRRLAAGGEALYYRLRRGRTQHLSISVDPDLSVSVVAPRGPDAREVDRRVLSHLAWIRRKQREFLHYHPLPVRRRFVSGETHYYLGRQYRLRVERGPTGVRIVGGWLVATVPNRSRNQVEAALTAWYKGRAREMFARRLEYVLRFSAWLGHTPERVRVRAMTQRWGSCSARGTITLNLHLVKTPPSCIDYVIAHELAHRLEMSHSRRFYGLLERAMPEWRRARERLNRSVA